MKRLNILHGIVFILVLLQLSLNSCKNNKTGDSDPMSEAYWEYWNPEVQAQIDRDIDKYRKADAILKIEGIPAGTEIRIEQITHDFKFGANIFNFNQLGSKELNDKYKHVFGSLFNSATIPFYWSAFELKPDSMRFSAGYHDSEEYWNQLNEPYLDTLWRRPAPEPIIEFCEEKGIRMHGHPITWGLRKLHYPDWIYEEFCPENEKEKIRSLGENGIDSLSPEEVYSLAPVYCSEINRLFKKRVADLAGYYGDRLDSWDVVNESAVDYNKGRLIAGDSICQSVNYGLMPGNYVYETFKLATGLFPEKVLLNINDYTSEEYYTDEVSELMNQGCRVDVIGHQMHLFDPQDCIRIARGEEKRIPEHLWKDMKILSRPGLPIHLSEITISAPENDPQGKEIQAIIAKNLYRLWFSTEQMMGITWWNVVDSCGVYGEPTGSGLFSRNMDPKPAFFVLDKLINDEWKTRTSLKADKEGQVKFRGFRGLYLVSWTDGDGNKSQKEFYLKNDGDGF